MKKLFYFAAGLLVMAGMAVSCTGTGSKADQEREDSIRRADSIAKVEAAIKDSIAKAEAARLDSIRQDSIAKAEEFSKALDALKEMTLTENSGKKLKELGFTGSTREEQSGQVKKLNYTLTVGSKTCKVSYTVDSTEAYCETEKITVEGDDEWLEEFYQKSLKRKGGGPEWFCDVTKKGNTVTIESCGA
ncbi:MAG: hypothetical protein J1E38_03125 [Paramuribaculum sp.]|nr:hypothetical protein [Paramuribaculum sp.]